MASYFKTGEHYYKSLDVFKDKSGEFVKNIEIVRYHMPSVIQKLPQNQTCFNILSVGSGTGEVDMEILKIIKEELQRTRGRHQIKIYNRAIEPNECACDLYKSSVKRANDLQIDFDVRCQTFQQYKEQGPENGEERTKFDVIHLMHSIYFLDIEESLIHCIENELNVSGSLFIMVEGPDLSFWVQYKERFPDRYGKPGDSFKTVEVEKIFKIIREAGWRYDVLNLEYQIDVTDVFDAESAEGNLLLDFLTHIKNFRDTADEQVVEEKLALIKDLSTVKDERRFGNKIESLFLIYK